MNKDKWIRLKSRYHDTDVAGSVTGIIIRVSDIAQIIECEDCCHVFMKNHDVLVPKMPAAHTADELLAMLNSDD